MEHEKTILTSIMLIVAFTSRRCLEVCIMMEYIFSSLILSMLSGVVSVTFISTDVIRKYTARITSLLTYSESVISLLQGMLSLILLIVIPQVHTFIAPGVAPQEYNNCEQAKVLVSSRKYLKML